LDFSVIPRRFWHVRRVEEVKMGEKAVKAPSSKKSKFLRALIGLGIAGVVGIFFWRRKRSF